MTERWDFWNGPDKTDRRVKYASEFQPEYEINGDDVQQRIAAVVTAFRAETGVELPDGYASGWRPSSVNEATANAGKTSAHLVAAAGDKRDTVNGDFAWWCFRNQGVLTQHGLYMEHPVATVVRAWATASAQKRAPTPWCHLTTRAPASHARAYWPDQRSLGEWEVFIALGAQAGMTFDAWCGLKRGEPTEEMDGQPKE